MGEQRANRLAALGLLWAFGVTLGRGLRRPNDWAEAHWLISYNFGFIKRGLAGSLLAPFLSPTPAVAETTIAVVVSLLTALLCAALVALCWSILRRCGFSADAVLAVAVFATSPFVVMTGHLNGYLDGPIILLSVLAIGLVWRGRLWAAALVLIVGLLVHETILLIGFPTALWAAWLRAGRDEATTAARLRRVAPLAAPLLAFALLFLYQSYVIDAARLESTLIAYLEKQPFIQYDQEVIVPRSFAKSFLAQFQSQSPRVWGRLFDWGLIVAVAPSLLVWLVFIGNALRAGGVSRRLTVAGGLLPFLPLALHLIAWDTGRIWTYPLVVALLVGWVACRAAEPARLRAARSAVLPVLALVALPINVFGRIPLMDWRVERFSAAARVALYVPAAVALALARRRRGDYTSGDRQFTAERP